jgi:hypothetical protein
MLSTYVLFTGGSHPKRTRYADPSISRRQEQQDARVATAVKKKRLEERKKKSLFANISDLKKGPKSKIRPRTLSPLASGMRAHLLIGRS